MVARRTARVIRNREAEFERLIGALYAAALDAEALPAVLSQLVSLCGGLWSPLTIVPLNGGQAVSFQNTEVDPGQLELFNARYVAPDTNPSMPFLLAAPSGAILLREQYFGDAEFERFDLYQDIYRPIGIYHSLGAVVLKSASHLAPLGITRPKRNGPFESKDLELLGRALPHLRRVLQIMVRMADLEGQAMLGALLWDRLPYGIIVLNGARRIVWANTAANALLARSDGLTSRAGLVRAVAPKQDATLQRLIGEAVGTGAGQVNGAGGVVAIPRSILAHESLTLLVSPMRPASALAASMPGTPAAVIFVTDPKSVVAIPSQILTALFGLTKREADLAVLLADGLNLTEAADRMAITMNTARTHLRQVFDKTGTRRQAELVRLLARSLPAAQPTSGGT